MKGITTTKRQITELKEQTIGKQKVQYQHSYDENDVSYQMINFSTQDEKGKTVSGNFNTQGELNINLRGVAVDDDLSLVTQITTTVFELVKSKQTQ